MKLHPIFLSTLLSLVIGCLTFSSNGGDSNNNATNVSMISGQSKEISKQFDAAVRLIPNFHQVNHDIYRSGRPTKEGVAALAGLGIKTILSIQDYGGDQDQAADERNWARAVNINWIQVPMHGLKRPTIEQIRLALSTLSDQTNYPMLVHCQKGSDRTGLVVASYHIKHDGWDIEKAKEDMYTFGHSRWLFWWDSVLDHI